MIIDIMLDQRTPLIFALVAVTLLLVFAGVTAWTDPRDRDYTKQWIKDASCAELKSFILEDIRDEKLVLNWVPFDDTAKERFVWMCEK